MNDFNYEILHLQYRLIELREMKNLTVNNFKFGYLREILRYPNLNNVMK